MNTERLAKIETITLLSGSHKNAASGLCAMEAVAWLAGEKHSDSPACACPVVSAAVRKLNDRVGDDEVRTRLLRPLLTRLIGSRSPPTTPPPPTPPPPGTRSTNRALR